jgi:hypothetical protein
MPSNAFDKYVTNAMEGPSGIENIGKQCYACNEGMIIMIRKIFTASLLIFACGGSASAADLVQPAEPEDEWVFTVAPYVWAAGLSGDVAQFGLPEVDVDVTFSDILEHFDIGLMGAAEARNGRFSLAADLLWVKLSDDKATPHGIIAEDVDVTAKTLMLTGAGAYSLIFEESGNLDILAGARLWSVKTELNFNGGLLDGVSADDNSTWVDPVVGLKGRFNIGSDFYLTGWGIIGGFGVSSEFMWDAMGALGYQFTDSFSMLAGYRGVGVDYHNDGFVYDIVQHGPIIGAVFRF